MWFICPLLSWNSTSNGKFNQVIHVPIQASNMLSIVGKFATVNPPTLSPQHLKSIYKGVGRGSKRRDAEECLDVLYYDDLLPC